MPVTLRAKIRLVANLRNIILLLVLTSLSGVMANEPKEARTTIVAELVKNKEFKLALEKIDSGADTNLPLPDGSTALHWALHHRNDAMVDRLISAGANPNAVNRYEVPPLWISCCAGDAIGVERLLNAGANANASLRGGESMLMTAARTGTPQIIEMLLKHGAEVDTTEQSGQTALMWSAAEGNHDASEVLLRYGADPFITLPSGFNAFFFAARQGKAKSVLQLLNAGYEINAKMKPRRKVSKGPNSGMTALMLCIENGHFELAIELINRGADPNTLGTGYAPLHAISWVRKPIRGDGDPPPIGSGSRSSLDLTRHLLENGAEVNLRHKKHSPRQGGLNRTDATPMILAAETGDLALLQLLHQYGGDPHLFNVDRANALLAASGIGVLSNGDESAGTEQDAIQTVRYLLDLGAEINSVDNHGKTVMHGAAFKSWPLLIEKLDQWGANEEIWNQKNQDGWTPLMIAQGHRPGNFRPSETTMIAIERLLKRSERGSASTKQPH